LNNETRKIKIWTNTGAQAWWVGWWNGGKRSTAEFRREAVRLALASGRTRREVAEDLGIGLSTLTRWVSQSRGLAEPAEVQADLRGELRRLRKENALLVAPNAAYSGPRTSNPPPFSRTASDATAVAFDLPLESTSVYAAINSSGRLYCAGWLDNL